jgi:hypothetical protein
MPRIRKLENSEHSGIAEGIGLQPIRDPKTQPHRAS